MRPLIEIQDDGVKAAGVAMPGGLLNHIRHIGNLHGYPMVGDRGAGQAGEGPLAPGKHHRVQFGHQHPGLPGEVGQGGLQAEPQAQTAHEDSRVGLIGHGLAGQFRQHHLGAVGRGVHQHPVGNGDQEIRVASSAQLQHPLGGGHAVNGLPRSGHAY